MALADPLAPAAFQDLLRLRECLLDLVFYQDEVELPGDTVPSDIGPARWKAKVTSAPMPHAEALGLIAKVNSRIGGTKKALLYDSRLPYPSTDKTGSIFGSATPVLGTITNRSVVSFTGFPNNYVVPGGTYFQIIWGSPGSQRYYLGQFVEDTTASGTGAIVSAEIAPPLPLSILPGAAVTVLKPAAKFRISKGTARLSFSDLVNSEVTFEAMQSYAPD